jgi:glyoxylase-like metal-dependent hydrolase (beta-lactamase superfamily II)
MQGTVTMTRAGAVTVHTYTAPEHGWRTNSHLIELPTQLIAFDTQLTLDYAAEVLAVAERIGKPITRLYISHAHPDHFVGTGTFAAETYSLASQRDLINSSSNGRIEHRRCFTQDDGSEQSTAACTIDHAVEPGTEIIDGVMFEFLAQFDAEATEQLAIGLPEQRILLAQDVVYHDVHLYIGGHTFDGLHNLAGLAYDMVLAGHIGVAELY